jgi:hypothetical protein
MATAPWSLFLGHYLTVSVTPRHWPRCSQSRGEHDLFDRGHFRSMLCRDIGLLEMNQIVARVG